MSWTPPKTFEKLTDILAEEFNLYMRDNLNSLKVNIALEAAQGIIISSGAIVKTQSHHLLESESGTEDDLETISGGADGEVLFLRAEAGHTITLKHDAGNIYNPFEEDVVITDSSYAILIHNGTKEIVYASGLSAGAVQALIDASIATHNASAATHIAAWDDLTIDADGAVDITGKTSKFFKLHPNGEETEDELYEIIGGTDGQEIYFTMNDEEYPITIMNENESENIWIPQNLVLSSDNSDFSICKFVYDDIWEGWRQVNVCAADILAHSSLGTGVHGAGEDTLATDADIAVHAAIAATHIASWKELTLDADGVLDITDKTANCFVVKPYEEAATDDLVTITGGTDGQAITLIAEGVKIVTILNSDNISIRASLEMGNSQYALYKFVCLGGYWWLISVGDVTSYLASVGIVFASSPVGIYISPTFALNADHTTVGDWSDVTVGETFTGNAFQVGYMKSDGDVYLAKADSSTTMPAFCMGRDAVNRTVGNLLYTVTRGYVRDDTWNWTPGLLYVSPDTAGAMTQVKPEYPNIAQVVAIAYSAHVIYFIGNVVPEGGGGASGSDAQALAFAIILGG